MIIIFTFTVIGQDGWRTYDPLSFPNMNNPDVFKPPFMSIPIPDRDTQNNDARWLGGNNNA